MQTHLAPAFAATPEGQEAESTLRNGAHRASCTAAPGGQKAESILRKCVHCGFCTATCPTYQLLGDELDGPRGRIYLMKQVLEGATPTGRPLSPLDRRPARRASDTT